MEFNDKLKERLEKAEAAGNKRVAAMIREALGPHAPKEKEKPKPKEGG